MCLPFLVPSTIHVPYFSFPCLLTVGRGSDSPDERSTDRKSHDESSTPKKNRNSQDISLKRSEDSPTRDSTDLHEGAKPPDGVPPSKIETPPQPAEGETCVFPRFDQFFFSSVRQQFFSFQDLPCC